MATREASSSTPAARSRWHSSSITTEADSRRRRQHRDHGHRSSAPRRQPDHDFRRKRIRQRRQHHHRSDIRHSRQQPDHRQRFRRQRREHQHHHRRAREERRQRDPGVVCSSACRARYASAHPTATWRAGSRRCRADCSIRRSSCANRARRARDARATASRASGYGGLPERPGTLAFSSYAPTGTIVGNGRASVFALADVFASACAR